MKRELLPEIRDWLEPRSKQIALALDYDPKIAARVARRDWKVLRASSLN